MRDRDLLEAIQGIALEASELALHHYGRVTPREKEDGSTLTQADEEVEDFLRSRLGKLLPEAAFIGEESTGDAVVLDTAQNREWVWVVDPIDGTAMFSAELDLFSVCVGLLRAGRPWAGAVALPKLGHLYSALEGQGAFLNGTPIRVRDEEPPSDRAFLCLSRNAHQYLDIGATHRVLSLGSTACNFLQVARGGAVGAVGRSHVWDHVAPAAILQEAGGIVRHHDGEEVDWVGALDGARFEPPLVATSPGLWERVVQSVGIRKRSGFHHRVNSQSAMRQFLRGSAEFAEGDVLLGHLDGKGSSTPIMAHPPDTESDLSFAEWAAVAASAERGIKVDLKDPRVVEPIIEILTTQGFPEQSLILNADVCVGPGNVPTLLSSSDLERLRAAFPRAILSVSATTLADHGPYTQTQISALRDTAHRIGGPVTLAVRVSIVRADPNFFNAIGDAHLTFWNGPESPADPAMVDWLREKRPDSFLDLTDAWGGPVAAGPT